MIAGVLAWLGPLSWFGKLSGDIRIEKPGFRFYMPITTMVAVKIKEMFLEFSIDVILTKGKI